ncbi:MAG: CoA-binding protein [Saprospiraceae bacterium]|nr:CoA-binding protein [Saprospiraceae bacterium]MCF8249501.1 CoA-binding protein [Saprospiraceae bacterium]MCF8280126.1 CoA-binding protein [Bacteroidales bacterium]MCF8310719.1 CoA-binding protein [Saprospiraceae bacterium]MCF8439450.1 CoA-binding protein [Saprospiraceae bacterium]
MKKTLVIGASTNPERYSYLAINALKKHGHEVVAIGRSEGEVNGVKIETDHPTFTDIDTVTMYVNISHQKEYYDYVLGLKPKRLIFNPGAENFDFMLRAKEAGIETHEACTLVMLSTGQF